MKKVLSFALALFLTTGMAFAQVNGTAGTNSAGDDVEEHEVNYDVENYVWIDLTNEDPMTFNVNPLDAITGQYDTGVADRSDDPLTGATNRVQLTPFQARTVKYSTNHQDVKVQIDWDFTADLPKGNAAIRGFFDDASWTTVEAGDGAAPTPSAGTSRGSGLFNIASGAGDPPGNVEDLITGISRSAGEFQVNLAFFGDQFVPAQTGTGYVDYVIMK
jgi:hypothetical protein